MRYIKNIIMINKSETLFSRNKYISEIDTEKEKDCYSHG